MPMGLTHRRINTIMSVPMAGSALYAGWQPAHVGLLVAGYTFATYFMNPDLDLNSLGYQSWGWLRIIWWPYQKVLGHRCWMSHFPVISTILRIIYLLWFPAVLVLLLGSSFRAAARETLLDWLPPLTPYIIVFIIGMVISDALHAVLDTASTELKQLFRSPRRRSYASNFFAHHHEPPPRRTTRRRQR